MMGKIILITGASNGIGKLTAERLVEKGHTVIAAIRGGEARAKLVFDAALLATGRLHAIDVHLERSETLELARTFVEKLGRLDVLINNAGYGALGPIEEQSEEEIRRQLEVNLVAPMLLTNALLPFLRASKGRVLNVAGAVGYVAMPFYALYCASKFAIEGWSEALAYDVKPFGVQVGVVEPGGFRTGFLDTAAKSSELVPQDSPYKQRADAMTYFLRNEAQKMNGDPSSVAKTLTKLATSGRVPMRTKVGADAVALSTLSWLAPTRVKMWLIDTAMSKTLFKPMPKALPAAPTEPVVG